MKALKIKFGFFSLLAVLAACIFLTSCEQELDIVTNEIQDITENTEHHIGEPIEEIVTYEEFEDLAALMQSQGYTPDEVEADFSLSDMDITSRNNSMCNTCNPWLSDISVYDLWGNVKGFSVNGGRNYPCSYDLEWKVFGPIGNSTINWQSGGFAQVTFNAPGTYYVVVRLRSTTGDGAPCYVFKLVKVVIS